MTSIIHQNVVLRFGKIAAPSSTSRMVRRCALSRATGFREVGSWERRDFGAETHVFKPQHCTHLIEQLGFGCHICSSITVSQYLCPRSRVSFHPCSVPLLACVSLSCLPAPRQPHNSILLARGDGWMFPRAQPGHMIPCSKHTCSIIR
jgi:hypothetical protein